MRANLTDEEKDLVDKAIQQGFEPSYWMDSMERVVDSYKNEVELLRRALRELAHRLKRLEKDVIEATEQKEKVGFLLAQLEEE